MTKELYPSRDSITSTGDVLPDDDHYGIEPPDEFPMDTWIEDMADHESFTALFESPLQDDVISVERGVSVSFDERKVALEAMAKIYSSWSRVKGMSKAMETPAGRDKLSRQYEDPEEVVRNALRENHYTRDDEYKVLRPLLKQEELIKSGFDSGEVKKSAFDTILDVRAGFGPDVKNDTRKANLKNLQSGS